jgi:hypothetical protein
MTDLRFLTESRQFIRASVASRSAYHAPPMRAWRIALLPAAARASSLQVSVIFLAAKRDASCFCAGKGRLPF